MGPSADHEELAVWCDGAGVGTCTRDKVLAFFEDLCRKAFKKPLLFVREYKIKVWRPYLKKMGNIRHVFTLNKTRGHRCNHWEFSCTLTMLLHMFI